MFRTSQGTGARHIEVQIMGFLAAKTPLEGASFGRYIANTANILR